ncbi:MAG: helix-turn-helix transcriptional regulator [Dissulfurispiraceae bacterium]|jgi:transcriptional regulator with XRE-family HTH domain
MALWDSIKEIRLNAGQTQKEFADAIGYTPEYISNVERSPDITRRIATEKMIKKIAGVYAKTEEERISLERKLLLERAQATVSPEVATHFLMDEKKRSSYQSEDGMPLVFIERLKKDLGNVEDLDAFFNSLKTTSRDIVDESLRGMRLLPRKTVVELTRALDQTIEEYLTLADYMPREFQTLIMHKGMNDIFRTLSELDSEELDLMIDVLSSVLRVRNKRAIDPSLR